MPESIMGKAIETWLKDECLYPFLHTIYDKETLTGNSHRAMLIKTGEELVECQCGKPEISYGDLELREGQVVATANPKKEKKTTGIRCPPFYEERGWNKKLLTLYFLF